MKNPVVSPMPIFWIVVLFFISLILPPTRCSGLIEEVCEQTPYYDLCVSSLQSDPGSSKADLKGLATIMASVVLDKAGETLRFIEGLIKEATDEQTERCLAYCAELYIPVVKYNIPQAIDGLKKDQFGIAIDGISDGAKEADSCEKKVSGSGSSFASSQSELFVRNDLVHKLCDVSVAIVKMLEVD